MLAVCPFVKCGKIIFRRAVVISNTENENILEFTTMCPHCKSKVKIKVGININVQPLWD